MTEHVSLVAVCAVGLALGCGSDPLAHDVTAQERGAALVTDPTLGREGNLLSCADCHEVTAGAGARIARPGAPLTRVVDRPRYWGGQVDGLLDAVNQCLYWFMGRSTPLAEEDEQGRDLYGFLASLDGDDAWATEQPFTIGDVAWPGPGDAARGAELYQSACAWCHGERGSGDRALEIAAPILPDDTLARHPPGEYTDEERRLVFVEKTRHGPFLGYGGTMPPISLETLDDSEMADVFTYLEVP